MALGYPGSAYGRADLSVDQSDLRSRASIKHLWELPERARYRADSCRSGTRSPKTDFVGHALDLTSRISTKCERMTLQSACFNFTGLALVERLFFARN